MDALVSSTLLTPRYLMKVIDDIPPQTQTYRGMDIMPLVEQPGPRVEWDIRKPLGGMTQAVARGAESPVIHRRGVGQASFEPAHFREKVILGESDVTTLRKLGSWENRSTAAELIAEIMIDLNARLETRVEWMRWQPPVSNALTISENKVQFTVSYYIPSRQRPTASPLWSVTATADPIEDIQTWIRLIRGTGGKIKKFWFNTKIQQYLFRNARVLSLVDRVFNAGNVGLMSMEILGSIFKTYIGNYEYEIYDAGYNLVTFTHAAQGAGAVTTLAVDDASGMAAADIVQISSGDEMYEENMTIASISGNTINFTGTTVTGTYAAASMIRDYKTFVPDNKFIMEVEFPPGSGPIGEVISVDAVYGQGSLTSPKPGKFAETIFLNKDPKQIEIIVGINALPVLYRKRGFITATIA
uniref:Putative capsid protein n=1 Tax=viral metagenome TaxID=1070528 RepID=A0A6M3KSX3_9ZZZZ